MVFVAMPHCGLAYHIARCGGVIVLAPPRAAKGRFAAGSVLRWTHLLPLGLLAFGGMIKALLYFPYPRGYPGLVAHSADGRLETVMYQFLPPMLLNEYQKQQRTIDAQAQEANRYKARLAVLEAEVAEIAELKQQMAHMAKLLDQLHRSDVVSAGLELK